MSTSHLPFLTVFCVFQDGLAAPATPKQKQYVQTSSKSARKNSSDRKQTTPRGAENATLTVPTADQLKRRRSTKAQPLSLSVRRMTKGSMDREHMAAAAAVAAAAAKPKVLLENTYRMSPSDHQQFSSRKAEEVIREVLESVLDGQAYDPIRAPTLAAQLSEQVKEAVKGLRCERHKLVTNVVLGPVQEQGMVVASRCLWDSSTDNSSTITYNNGKVLVIANVFAVYFEWWNQHGGTALLCHVRACSKTAMPDSCWRWRELHVKGFIAPPSLWLTLPQTSELGELWEQHSSGVARIVTDLHIAFCSLNPS